MKKILVLPALILLLFAVSCQKKEDTNRVPALTSGMGNMRTWHRSHYYEASGMHYPTPVMESYFLPDTTFALTVVDDSTVQFNGVNYSHDSTDLVKQIRYFGSAFAYYNYLSNGRGVAYFYGRDSIVWCYGSFHNTNDMILLQDLCYSF